MPRNSLLSLPLYSTGQIKSQAQPRFKRWEGSFHLLMGGTAESFYRGRRYGNDGILVAVSAFSPSLVSASLSCHRDPAPCGAWGQAAAELCVCFSREWRRPSSACFASNSELDSGPPSHWMWLCPCLSWGCYEPLSSWGIHTATLLWLFHIQSPSSLYLHLHLPHCGLLFF